MNTTFPSSLRATRQRIALAFAFASLAIGAPASAESTPTGLGCSVGYSLVITANVLTCRKPLTTGTVLNTAAPICTQGTLTVQNGDDICDSLRMSPIPPVCTIENYFRKADYSGATDKCVTYGYVYEAPKTI